MFNYSSYYILSNQWGNHKVDHPVYMLRNLNI